MSMANNAVILSIKKFPASFQNFVKAALMIFLLAGLTVSVFVDDDAKSALVFDYKSDISTTVQVFFDVGMGFQETHSSRQFVVKQSEWREIKLDIPAAKVLNLRLDPSVDHGVFGLRNPRLIDADGTIRLAIPLAKIRPSQQILSLAEHNAELEIKTVPGANDPVVEIPFESAVYLGQGRGWRLVPLLLGWISFWTAVVFLLYYAPRFLEKNANFLAPWRKPVVTIWLAAAVGTLVSASPIIFQGKSFMSPNSGAQLFYDRFPTLPNYSDSTIWDAHNSDTGAMMWQHFPLTVAQERAVKEFGEFPLWNRYNSAGTTMIGQGQMMLGDPLNWVMWLVGVDAGTFDIKFLLLRMVFAASLGLVVLLLTQKTLPAVIVTMSAAFIGYFLYRVNHPAIFTLCYSPLIILAWLKVIYAEEERSRLGWITGLMLANWLVLNSGTAKEAYMSIVVLNAIGMGFFIAERSRIVSKFKMWLGLLVVSGICFLMIASPVWGTFYDTIRSGASGYGNPSVQQWPFWYLLGFVDNFFYLLRVTHYFPAVNALLFVGFLLGIVCAIHAEKLEVRRAAMVLVYGCGALIALAFGVIPEKLLLATPFINNVHHIHNTFSTILIVPVSILAGIGFANIDTQEANSEKNKLVVLIVVLALISLILLYVLSFAQGGGLRTDEFIVYAVPVLIAAMLAPWMILRLLNGQLSLAGIGVCLIVIIIVLGRGAMYIDYPDKYVFNPHERVSLTARPEIVGRLTNRISAEPTRVVGLGGVLIPGFNATYGLENVSGPDAMFNRRYRELTAALKMPYEWGWKLIFDRSHLVTHKNVLDLLGVGMVLSSAKIGEVAGVRQFDDDGTVSAYSRDSVWPRAFYTDQLVLYNDAQTLADRISTGDGRPFVAVEKQNVDGNSVLQRLAEKSSAGPGIVVKAGDYVLTNNSTGFSIDAPATGIVYLGEVGDPDDFVVTMNGERVSYVVANHAFKAVIIEKPGKYQITFRYWPAHLTLYLMLAALGTVTWLTICIVFWKRSRRGNEAVQSTRINNSNPA